MFRGGNQPWFSNKSTPDYLRSKIRDGNETFEDVLWEDVGVTCLLDVIRRHVDVVSSKVKISC